MLENFRTQKIIWDRANKKIFEKIEANSGDSNGRKLVVQVINQEATEVLSGTTLSLGWKSRQGAKGLDAFNVVDASKGIFEIYYTTEMLSNIGNIEASLILIDSTGRIESSTFTISVRPSTVDDESVESENSFTALTEALVKVNEWNGRIDDVEQDYANRAEALEETYAPRLTEVTAQLAQTAQQVKKQTLTPLYIETLASFSRFGGGVPSGVRNYVGGNYELTVNGVAGDSFLTVTAGNIADAGVTSRWAAVLEKPNLTYEGYRVTGTDGISKIYVYPNVRENVTGAVLANLHDMAQGQHYTEKGYKAFGQHIFNGSGYYSQRLKYIARFLSDETEGPWVGVGNVSSITYNRGMHPVDLDDGIIEGQWDKSLTFHSNEIGEGLEWEVAIDKDVGYFEGFFGIHDGSDVEVQFFVDGILHESKTIYREVERVIFDFNFGDKAKVKVISNTANNTTVRIGNCYWWATEKVPMNLFNKTNKRAVYLGDSWGTYHNAATPNEIERLWKGVNPDATVINHSRGGMTTNYGRAWFDEFVLKENPDVVIIEYFTNDIVTILQGTGLTFIDPNGDTQSTVVTKEEFFENLRYMIDTAIENNIQPIVVLPAAVESDIQIQYHAQYSAELANGGSVTPLNGNFTTVNSKNAIFDEVLTDKIETKTEVNVPLQITPSTAGVVIKPRLTMYAGTPFKMENGGSELLSVSILSGTGYTRDANLSVTAITLKPLDVLPTASITHRGRIVAVNGGVGVADKMYRCVKNASDTYEWKEL